MAVKVKNFGILGWAGMIEKSASKHGDCGSTHQRGIVIVTKRKQDTKRDVWCERSKYRRLGKIASFHLVSSLFGGNLFIRGHTGGDRIEISLHHGTEEFKPQVWYWCRASCIIWRCVMSEPAERITVNFAASTCGQLRI